MAEFELVIFDCDGVLVDSERIANEVFAKILNEECGFSLSLQDMFDTFVGRSAAQCMEIIEHMYGREPPPGLALRYENEINAALRESVVAVEGVEQVLEDLDRPWCVASSGSYEKMRTTLGKANLLERMQGKLFSTFDVPRGKPFADIYLHAAKQMGCTDPRRCLVIEDSPVGVSGGVAAGMVVFGFAQLMREQQLIDAGAHRIFKQMTNLVDEITAWEQSNA